ncbi:MAG: hypothetical protein R3Y65_05895 [Bacillota bacterium]
MKHENIKSQIKSSIISACVSFVVKMAIVVFTLYNIESIKSYVVLYVIAWAVVIAIILQIIFLPFMVRARIKEIKKGEIYEASKY